MSQVGSVSQVESVVAELHALRERLESTLRAAVRIPSVSPAYPGVERADHLGRETEVAELLAGVYAEAGATTEIVEVEAGRGNALGTLRGAGGGRSLVLNGHVDVVPPGDGAGWTYPPFDAHVEGGRMYGRGTADMKAGLVAQAFAVLALRRAGVDLAGDLQLQAVVGEETGEHDAGIRAAIGRGFAADLAIVAEPSGLVDGTRTLQIASPGLRRFTVTVRGRRAHGCLRGETVHPTNQGSAAGVNAIDKGFYVYSALRQLEQEWAETKRHPLFRNGHFALSPAVVRAQADDTPVPAILPNWMSTHYSVIHHPDESPEDVEREIETHVARAAQLDPWLREHPPEIEWWEFRWPALSTPPDHPGVVCMRDSVERAASGEARLELAASQGVSDAAHLQTAGTPAVVFGPGALAAAHADDESVELAEVHLAARTYALAVMDWCGTT